MKRAISKFSLVEAMLISAVLAILMSIAAPAFAVNKIFLKPDGAVVAPCTVWGNTTNALACGKGTTAPASGVIADLIGVVRVASSTTAGFAARWLGALAAKPATSQEGDQYYDTIQHTIAMATATKSDNSAWVKANTATTGAAWTLY